MTTIIPLVNIREQYINHEDITIPTIESVEEVAEVFAEEVNEMDTEIQLPTRERRNNELRCDKVIIFKCFMFLYFVILYVIYYYRHFLYNNLKKINDLFN